MALVVVTWLWGEKYKAHYVTRLVHGLQRGLRQTFEFKVVAPLPDDGHLLKGCLCRLRMFSTEWQGIFGIKSGDKIVCLDLDLIVTGELDPLFDRPENFVILQGANATNPCPFNGSVMMLRAGAHQEVWSDFTQEEVKLIPKYEFPDDQGWLWHKLPDAAGWEVGPSSGIYAFRKPKWPPNDILPPDARIVAFPGHRDPSQFMHLPWIQKYWARGYQ